MQLQFLTYAQYALGFLKIIFCLSPSGQLSKLRVGSPRRGPAVDRAPHPLPAVKPLQPIEQARYLRRRPSAASAGRGDAAFV
jgi:hypothetical protein